MKSSWTIYHPNANGTGSAIKLELSPADGKVEGSILVTLSPQSSIGSSMTNPRFDWTNAICVKLTIFDLARFLQVLRGMEESIDDGKGLFHRTTTGNNVIKFEHRIEPVHGYFLDVSSKPNNGDMMRVLFFFQQAEALAFLTVIEQSLSILAFGVPTL